jgi:hypothetical protein
MMWIFHVEFTRGEHVKKRTDRREYTSNETGTARVDLSVSIVEESHHNQEARHPSHRRHQPSLSLRT